MTKTRHDRQLNLLAKDFLKKGYSIRVEGSNVFRVCPDSGEATFIGKYALRINRWKSPREIKPEAK